MVEKGRILALDYGAKRIGLAMSDPFAVIASGCGTITNDEKSVAEIGEIIENNSVVAVIIGMPYSLSGEESRTANEVRRFMDILQKSIDIPIIAVDERFTSVLAANTIRQMGIGKKKRERNKGKIDELAAVHLLQGYLQSPSTGF